MRNVGPSSLAVEQSRLEVRREQLVEWYLNDERGLEQGFTLLSAPSGERADNPVVLEMRSEGGLGAFPDQTGQSILFKATDGKPVLRCGDLAVRDERGEQVHGRLAVVPMGIQIRIEDQHAVYPLTVDAVMTSPIWTADSNQASARLGGTVSTAGDVNGDGYSDVIVGAAYYDNGESDEGRAFVYLGSAAGLASSPAWTAESNQANANFGISVSAAGDVNGDGYDDVIVGAWFYDCGETDEGAAFVYHGSASGLATSPAWMAQSDQSDAQMGFSVQTAGDVNRDGYDDVITSARLYDDGETNEGRAYVYLGSASGLATTAAWTSHGNQAGANFGYSVSGAGDVNGDGYDDVTVGALAYDNGETDEGRAYVYLGSGSGLATSPVWTAESNQDGAYFGRVARAGDVNGDGFADVIVGAQAYDGGETDEGRVWVYLGSASGPAPAASWFAENNATNSQFGISVGSAGDVNGDGYADVVIGADQYTDGQTNEGSAYIYLGSSQGLASTPIWMVESDQALANCGQSVATAGDVNGDGYSDVLVGALNYDNPEADEGAAFVYLGSGDFLPTYASWTSEADGTAAFFGTSVASAGDVNGDGYSDIIVGAPFYDSGEPDSGGAFVYQGSAGGLSSVASWVVETDQQGAFLGRCVSGAGDVNGDGYSDVIVGADAYGATHEGAAFVYLGSPAGLSTSAAWTMLGDQNGVRLGTAVATAGDVNGDGYGDVIIGVPLRNNPEPNEGRAYVYLGSASGLALSPVWTADSNQGFAHFGNAVGAAGDVNGDGYSDVIVGAKDYDNPDPDEGRAYVYLGSASGLMSFPSWTAEGDRVVARFGYSVGTAGDVNGDGYSDVIVGALQYENGEPEEGRAYVYLGSAAGLMGVPSWTAESNQGGALFGCSVATAGDVNGDGFSDVIVGACGFDSGQDDEGRASLYRGSANGLGNSPTWTGESNQPSANFGTSVASAGDVNGDGFADVIVGAPGYDNGESNEGRVHVYLGGGGDGLDWIARQARTDLAAPIDLLGRSDGTTAFRLRSLGRSAAGREEVRFEWEVKPLGISFDGVGIAQSALQDTGPPGGSASFSESAANLNAGTFYHWRARIRSDNPFFPGTPWKSQARNNATEEDLRTSGCVDMDADGRGAPPDPACATSEGDCNDSEPGAWDTPGPTRSLRFASKVTLSWDPPLEPGAKLTALVYDVLRSSVASTFLTADCLESDDGPNTIATDLMVPGRGQVFFYITRAQNACPDGIGSLGTNTSGFLRAGRACP